MAKTTAHDFIRESALLKARKYLWIQPLIEDVLQDEISDIRISEYIRKLFDFEVEKVVSQVEIPEKTDAPFVSKILKIRKLKSIDNVDNVGLLSFTEPIHIQDGLNVFYGKNGAGKSSLYQAICNTLGVRKKIYPNLHASSSTLFCQTTIESIEGKEIKLTWDGEKGIEKSNIKVLDSDACMHLVEKDQPNEFELSHLKSEYFGLVSGMFDKVATSLDAFEAKSKSESLNQALLAAFPAFFSLPKPPTEKELGAISFTEEDEKSIQEGQSEIEALSLADTDATIKNLEEANRSADKVLSTLCALPYLEGEPPVQIFPLRVTKSLIRTFNEMISKSKHLKATLNEIGVARLNGLIPNDWISKNQWSEFIRASLTFVSSLDKPVAEEYGTRKCIYCQQKLVTPESISLIKAYHELQNTTQSESDKIEIAISSQTKVIAELIASLEVFPELISKINNEIIQVGIPSPLVFPIEEYKSALSKLKLNLERRDEDASEGMAAIEIVPFISQVQFARDKILSLCEKIKESNSSRASQVAEIRKRIAPLELKRGQVKYSPLIIESSRATAKCALVDQKKNDLTAMRQLCSTLSTKFSKEVPLEIFQSHLKDEYKALKFTPPDTWSIKVSSSGKENKRIYSLKDRRLSEIFSEGERKIHAFADFLAQCEMNKFQGIFLMDDPVNSLDEDKMECIKDRIYKLIESGNQVIVFTHNLVFLNMLVDTSDQEVVHIDKLDNQILVESDSLLGSDHDLKRRKKVIDGRFAEAEKKKELQQSEFFLRNMYDLMSGHIESYVEIKIFKDVINRYRPNIRMHSLSKLTGFDPTILTPIINLYGHTSRKGSRHSQPTGAPAPNYEEFKEHYSLWKETTGK